MPWSYWSETRYCYRRGCTRCPHGPYWFGEYSGKRLYFGVQNADPATAPEHLRSVSLTRLRAAARLIGCSQSWDAERAASCFLAALMRAGDGSHGVMAKRRALVNAWHVLCWARGWVQADEAVADQADAE